MSLSILAAMSIADSQGFKALHSAKRLSVAELLAKLARNNEPYVATLGNKFSMMIRTARDQEIEKAQMADVKPDQENKSVLDQENKSVLDQEIKQMLDQEVNARMEEWFAEAANMEPKQRVQQPHPLLHPRWLKSRYMKKYAFDSDSE